MSGSLEQQAEQFARELSDLASAFTGAPLPFRSSSLDTRVSVAPDAPIPVSVDDTTLFSVSARFRCVYDHVNDFLRIDTSAIKVFAGPGARGEPLFRYEYVSSQSPDLPSAHLQIHAHRDQLMMAMAIAGSTGARRRAQLFTDYPATAQMARLHFPMGGASIPTRTRRCAPDASHRVRRIGRARLGEAAAVSARGLPPHSDGSSRT